MPFGTLAIRWLPRKILRRSSQENPSVEWGLNVRGSSKPNIAILYLSKTLSRERCKIGGMLVLITNKKSHFLLWAFGRYQNRWPWMSLNGVMALTLCVISPNSVAFGRGSIIKNLMCDFVSFSPRRGDPFNRCQWNLAQRMGLKVSLNRPNLVLLRYYLGIYASNNIFRIRSNRNTAICYVDDTSLRRNARPVMHWLLANVYVFLVLFVFCSACTMSW